MKDRGFEIERIGCSYYISYGKKGETLPFDTAPSELLARQLIEEYGEKWKRWYRQEKGYSVALSMTQAANQLGVTRQRVHQLIQEGKLPAQKRGGAWLPDGGTWIIDSDDLAAYTATPRRVGRPPKQPPPPRT
jgi:excisionase family DNA binding protein